MSPLLDVIKLDKKKITVYVSMNVSGEFGHDPHIHWKTEDGRRGRYFLNTGEIDRGELTRNELKLVDEWVDSHWDSLDRAWRGLEEGRDPREFF